MDDATVESKRTPQHALFSSQESVIMSHTSFPLHWPRVEGQVADTQGVKHHKVLCGFSPPCVCNMFTMATPSLLG